MLYWERSAPEFGRALEGEGASHNFKSQREADRQAGTLETRLPDQERVVRRPKVDGGSRPA